MSSLAPSLARRAKQVLSTKTDEESLIEALGALSGLAGEKEEIEWQPQQLQTTIENGGVDCATELLSQGEELLTELQNLQHYMNLLMESCHTIQSSLSHCKATTVEYLDAIHRLEDDKQSNEEKDQLIKEFLSRYQLLPQEISLLQEGEISKEFFEVLERAQSIHTNCKSLLRTQHQRAGLDLMDTMARFQESALKRLVQWVQTKCQELIDVEAAEMDVLMRRALTALSTRPVLYKYCAEEVAEARHHALFERFVVSLSRGPRPIEMQSDDPKRYLNDMLAWVHQALASEKELLELLFKDSVQETQDEKNLPSISGLLDKIFLSIDRPLKARIEQVLMLPPPPVLCFELSRLLEFYFGVVSELLGLQTSLIESLQSCRDMAERTFHEQIHARGIRLTRHSLVIPRDLSPPSEVHETITFLLQILDAEESALKISESKENQSLTSTVGAVLDPLLETCQKCSEDLDAGPYGVIDDHEIKNLISKESFMINCLETIVHALKNHKKIQTIWKDLDSKLKAHVSKLVSGVVNSTLQDCGLADIVKRMREYQNEVSGVKMSTDSALRLTTIVEGLQRFISLITNTDREPEFSGIMNAYLKHEAMMSLSQDLIEGYELVYNAIYDPKNGYNDELQSIQKIEYTPEDVRTVLSVK